MNNPVVQKMLLKRNKALKLLILLLFVLELLAPVLSVSQDQPEGDFKQKQALHSAVVQFNWFSLLFCEEAGSEEEREDREHKDVFIAFLLPLFEFDGLSKSLDTSVYLSYQAEIITAKPSILTLLGSYRI